MISRQKGFAVVISHPIFINNLMKLLTLIKIINEDATSDSELVNEAKRVFAYIRKLAVKVSSDAIKAVQGKANGKLLASDGNFMGDAKAAMLLSKTGISFYLDELPGYSNSDLKQRKAHYLTIKFVFGTRSDIAADYHIQNKIINVYLDVDINTPFKNIIYKICDSESNFIHEFTHYYDDMRSRGKAFSDIVAYNGDNTKEVYSKTHEINAMFSQLINRVMQAIHDGELWNRGMNFDTFHYHATERYASKTLRDVMNSNINIKNTITKRLYKIYDEILKDNNVGIENGQFTTHPF